MGGSDEQNQANPFFVRETSWKEVLPQVNISLCGLEATRTPKPKGLSCVVVGLASKEEKKELITQGRTFWAGPDVRDSQMASAALFLTAVRGSSRFLILQVRRPRLRMVRSLAQCHVTVSWQSPDLSPSLCTSKLRACPPASGARSAPATLQASSQDRGCLEI